MRVNNVKYNIELLQLMQSSILLISEEILSLKFEPICKRL